MFVCFPPKLKSTMSFSFNPRNPPKRIHVSRTPNKPEYLIARIATSPKRGPLGFGTIQFLMDTTNSWQSSRTTYLHTSKAAETFSGLQPSLCRANRPFLVTSARVCWVFCVVGKSVGWRLGLWAPFNCCDSSIEFTYDIGFLCSWTIDWKL